MSDITFTPEEDQMIRAALNSINFNSTIATPDFEAGVTNALNAHRLWVSIDAKLKALCCNSVAGLLSDDATT